MRVPIEAVTDATLASTSTMHHPLKMRVPIEASMSALLAAPIIEHHPLKMRVPIEASCRPATKRADWSGITL